MTLDIRARATADKLIGKFGKQVTLTRITEGTYNPDTGELSGGSTTTQTVAALVKDFNGIELLSGVIQVGDRKIKISALQVTEPQIGDTVTIDSLVYNVLAVKSIWSGEKVAIYELQVRK
jgi:hypothetical protein